MITEYSTFDQENMPNFMYVIKLGDSYEIDYVGFFETKQEALDWLEKEENQDLANEPISILCVKNKSIY
jgi:hypothetical protein